MTFPAVDPKESPSFELLTECAQPMLSPNSDEELLSGTVEELHRYNVRRAVLAGRPELVRKWLTAAPGLFIPATAPADASPASIVFQRRLHREGLSDVIAEVGTQYAGLRADDPKLEPLWAMVEEMDVPVGIHLGEGMPGQDATSGPDAYRVRLTSPFQLEEVLLKHPRLRLWVMHAASPLTDEMIAMLFEFPTLHVDLAANDWTMPRSQYYDQLKRLVDAGFSKRILFGSDPGVWPQAIGLAIRSIEEAPFLSPEQKRDILYNNAARFLRLTKEQIAADRAP